jgi:hypothetical protein
MEHYCALSSIIFMMSFVFLFDGSHQRKRLVRLFQSLNLYSKDELDQVRAIWTACQET